MDHPSWAEGSGRKLLAALWGGWPVVAVAVLVLAGGAYLYAKRQPPVYKASGRVFLNVDALGEPGQDVVRLVSTQAELASSTPVVARMSNQLGVPVEEAEQRLAVTPAEEGNYFTIAGTGGTAAAAADLVKAAQRSYEEVVSGQQQKNRRADIDNLVEARVSLERELEQARTLRDETPEDSRLQARVDLLAQQLKTLRTRQSDALLPAPTRSVVQLAEAPQIPTTPMAPKPLWTGIVAGLLGAIIGVTFVWWRSERFAVTHKPGPAAAQLGIPVLGRLRPRRGHQAHRLAASGTEPAVAQLALAVELAGRHRLGRELGVLGVVHPDPAEHDGIVALGLASALASAGRRVLLADGHQHEPLLATLTSQGLLAPRRLYPSARQPLRTRTDDQLSVLSLGLDGHPGQAATAHAVLADARQTGDLVVLLSPPATTPQAALLLAACDAVVLIAGSRTRLADLVDVKARLDDLERPTLGLISEKTAQFAPRRRRPHLTDQGAPRTGVAGPRTSQEPVIPSESVDTPSAALRVLGAERSSAEEHLDESSNGGQTSTQAPKHGQVLDQLLGTTPHGWREYIEPRFDFGIAIPPGWNPVEGRADVMAFYNPNRNAFISLERVENPSALPEDPEWSYDEDQHDDYERIKLESNRFKGWSAVEWEFAYTEDETRLHSTDLRLFSNDVVYRLIFQAPDAVWTNMQSTLARIRDSFKVGIPTGPP
jgi:Mrp family chromosome partitioning ATPase/capsular polysaccharide biosynthesis protein